MGKCFNDAATRAANEPHRTAAAHAADAIGPSTRVRKVSTPMPVYLDEIAPAYKGDTDIYGYQRFTRGKLDDGLRGQKFVTPRGETQADGLQVLIEKQGPFHVLKERRGHRGEWKKIATGREQNLSNEIKTRYGLYREVENFASPSAHALMKMRKADILEEDWDSFRSTPERVAVVTNVLDAELADIGVKLEEVKEQYAEARKTLRVVEETVAKQKEVDVGRAAMRKKKLSKEQERQIQLRAAEDVKKLKEAREIERRAGIEVKEWVDKLANTQRSYDLFLRNPDITNWTFEGFGADKLTQVLRAGDQFPFWSAIGDRASQAYNRTHTAIVEAIEGLVGTNSAMLPGRERKLTGGSVTGFQRSNWDGGFERYHQEVRDIYTEMHGLGTGYTAGKIFWNEGTHALETTAKKVWSAVSGEDLAPGTTRMTWTEFSERISRDGNRWLEQKIVSDNPFVQRAIEATTNYMRDAEEEIRRTGTLASIEGLGKHIDDIQARLENPPFSVYDDVEWERAYREEIKGVSSQAEPISERAKQKRRAAEEWRGVEQPATSADTLESRYGDLFEEQKARVREEKVDTEEYVRAGMQMRMIREELDVRFIEDLSAEESARKTLAEILAQRQVGIAPTREQLDALEDGVLAEFLVHRKNQLDSGVFEPAIDKKLRSDVRMAENELARREGRPEIPMEERTPFESSVEHAAPSRWRAEAEMQVADLAERHRKMTSVENKWRKHLPRRWNDEYIAENTEDLRILLRKWYTEEDPAAGQTDELLEQRVESAIRTMQGENTYGDMAGILQYDAQGRPIPMRPGALGRRRLDMPSTYTAERPDGSGTVDALDFLFHDQVQIVQTYINRVSGAVEMQRKFGDMSMEGHLAKLERLGRAEGMPEEVLQKQLERVRDLRNTVLGIDAIHEDPTRLDHRVLRAGRNLNVLAFMGRMAQMQIIDMGNMVAVDGFRNLMTSFGLTFVHRATSLGRAMSKENSQTFGAASEITFMTKGSMVLNQNTGMIAGENRTERWLREHAHSLFYWNGSAWMTDMMRMTGGNLAQSRLLKLAEKAADGTLSNQDLARMRAAGIDRDMAVRIYEEWNTNVPKDRRVYRGLFGGELRLASTDQWLDQDLKRVFAAAVRGDMDSIVFTMNPGTKPKFLNNEYMRSLLLYQSINMQMTQTLTLGLMQRGMRELLLASLSMMSLAFLVSTMRNPDYVERDFEDALYEAVMMSGLTGIFGAMYEQYAEVTGSMPGLGRLGVENKAWAEGTDLTKISPIVSQWGALGQALFNPDAQADELARASIYMLPYNNLLWIKEPFDLQAQARRGLGAVLETGGYGQ